MLHILSNSDRPTSIMEDETVRTLYVTPAHLKRYDYNYSTIPNLRDANIHVNCYNILLLC